MSFDEDYQKLRKFVLDDDLVNAEIFLKNYTDFNEIKRLLTTYRSFINDENNQRLLTYQMNHHEQFSMIYYIKSYEMIILLNKYGADINSPKIIISTNNKSIGRVKKFNLIELKLKSYLTNYFCGSSKFDMIKNLLNKGIFSPTELNKFPIFISFIKSVKDLKFDLATELQVNLRKEIVKISNLLIGSGLDININSNNKNLIDSLICPSDSNIMLGFELDIISDLVELGLDITKSNKDLLQRLYSKDGQDKDIKTKISKIKENFDSINLINVSLVCKEFVNALKPLLANSNDFPKYSTIEILQKLCKNDNTEYVLKKTSFEQRVMDKSNHLRDVSR